MHSEIPHIKSLLEAEKIEEASLAIQQALSDYPDSTDLLTLLGELYLKKGNIQEAKKMFSDISANNPNNLEALNNLAVCMIYENDMAGAVDLLSEVLEKDPSNTAARENLHFIKNDVSVAEARQLIQKGSIPEAKLLLEQVLSYDDKHIEALNDLAAIFIQEEEFEKAEKNISDIFQLDPSNTTAMQNLRYLEQKVIEYHLSHSNNCTVESERKIISVHIPKCAGTSFRGILQNHFGGSLFLDYGFEAALLNKFHLTMNRSTRCIHGHFRANKYDPIFPTARLITWLRNPVQRVISYYSYFLRNPQSIDPICKAVHENKLSLLEFADMKEARNAMTYFFAGKRMEDFAFVGIMEFFEESLEQFCELIGIPCPTEIPKINVNETRKNSQYKVTKKVLDEILRLNSLDVALYQEALDVFHSEKRK